MQYTILVCLVALAEYLFFTSQTGRARVKYDVPAPATAGHSSFERLFRVQQNTLEQLIVFLPAAFLFAHLVSDVVAASIGGAFVIGRAIYYVGYTRDPKRRAAGMLLTFFSNVALVIGALYGAIRTLG